MSSEREVRITMTRSEAMRRVWRKRRLDAIISREEGMRPISVGIVRSTLCSGRVESWGYTMTKPSKKGSKWREVVGLDR